jgi:hypothetical protein
MQVSDFHYPGYFTLLNNYLKPNHIRINTYQEAEINQYIHQKVNSHPIFGLFPKLCTSIKNDIQKMTNTTTNVVMGYQSDEIKLFTINLEYIQQQIDEIIQQDYQDYQDYYTPNTN